MVLGLPTTTGIEEYKDVLRTCVQHLQGKMMFGELLLQNKVVGSLSDAFPDFDLGWAFFSLGLLKKLLLFSINDPRTCPQMQKNKEQNRWKEPTI